MLFPFLFSLLSCGVEEFLPPDYLRPVSGVQAYPHNGSVTILFHSQNSESKFDGFNVYLSTSSSLAGRDLVPIRNNNTEPTFISSASVIATDPVVTIHLDEDSDGNPLQNGTTYYFAVRAHNYDSFESDFSMEVSTTPRVESVTQCEVALSNGYSLRTGSSGQPWDFKTVMSMGNLHFVSTTCQIKDEGFYDNPMSYNKVTDGGFSLPGSYIRIYTNHLYVFKTDEDRFGKVYIDSIDGLVIHFRWAYQAVLGNKDI